MLDSTANFPERGLPSGLENLVTLFSDHVDARSVHTEARHQDTARMIRVVENEMQNMVLARRDFSQSADELAKTISSADLISDYQRRFLQFYPNENRLNELANLPNGWDGYNGLPAQRAAVEYARCIMDEIREYTLIFPAIVPLSDGGLQLEWFVGAHEIEVTIAPDGSAQVYFECRDDGRNKEVSLSDPSSIKKFAHFFQELRR